MSHIEEEIELLERAIDMARRAEKNPGLLLEDGTVVKFEPLPTEQLERRLATLKASLT